MLICPNCNFENPESHNFCQKCGNSLTHTLCQQCGINIPLNNLQCDVCGTANKILLWGVIDIPNRETEPSLTSSELTLTNAIVNPSSLPKKALTNKKHPELLPKQDVKNFYVEPNQKYLDTQQRYTIEKINSDHPLSINSDWNFIQVQVVDEFPLKPPYLKKLKQQQPELFEELGETLDSSYFSMAEYWNMVGVPTIAIPYLLLKNYCPIIPQLYDAWQEDKQGIILLEDRSKWQLLGQIWSQKDLDLLQLLWSLDELLKLWTPLSQIACATSLLVETNLLLDEDQSFCLRQLYMDNPGHPPKISDLATKLKYWLQHSPQSYYEKLKPLLEQTITGKIGSIEELRQQLHELVAPKILEEPTNSNDLEPEALTFDDPAFSQEFADFGSYSDNSQSEDPNLIYDSFIYNSDSDEQPTALLPMDIEKIDHASRSDVGSQRDHNEDFFGITTTVITEEKSHSKTLTVRNLYLVCDGMGGHAAGEVASAMAVETLQNYFHTHWHDELPNEATIKDGILLANKTLCEINSKNSRSGSGRMGTTLVMALIQNRQLAIAHVGDSRIYRFTRKRGLEQLTVDHEVGQREINRGVEPEIAYGRPDAYQLTQALGPRESKHLRPSINFWEIEEDSLLLLCSDGLSDNQLLQKHGESYLKPLISSSADLESGLSELIDFANEYNGHDNITAILVRVKLKPHL